MLSELDELDAQAREEGATYPKKRWLAGQISPHIGKRVFLALIGPRGAGKTVLLKQLRAEAQSSFYISLDAQTLEPDLFQAAKELSQRGIKLLLLDEVHAYADLGRDLKKTFDFLPIQIVFTSSSALSLHDSAHDLSRRVHMLRVPPFSLREFIRFESNEELQALKFQDFQNEAKSREYYGKILHAESFLEPYLNGRNYPFTLSGDTPHAFSRLLETVIQKDIVMAGRATPDEALEMRKMLRFVGLSRAEDMSYTSIAKNCAITAYKAEKYIDLFDKAFILHRVLPAGTNVLREPKVLFAPPYRLIYRPYADCIGALREDFFVDSMRNLGMEPMYLKSARGEKTPDYLIGDMIFEVGGASKGFSQLKGAKNSRAFILTHPGRVDSVRRPLIFCGMFAEIDARSVLPAP